MLILETSGNIGKICEAEGSSIRVSKEGLHTPEFGAGQDDIAE